MNSLVEGAIEQRIKPIVESAMRKHLGIAVSDIEADITDQLKRSTLLDVAVNTKTPYKQAKKAFKRAYLLQLLQQHLGNISTAATVAGLDRRSIHRLVTGFHIPTTKLRETAQPSYGRQAAVQGIIQDVIEQYRSALNPIKYKAFTGHAEALSEEIVKELPEGHLTIEEAERAFERSYFTQLLKECSTIAAAARRSGLRYEVLHRKLKMLGIKPQKQ
jgi:DNA-binding NtrC family response regulator